MTPKHDISLIFFGPCKDIVPYLGRSFMAPWVLCLTFSFWSFQTVYDKDTFTDDDKMGDAEIDIKLYLECMKRELQNLPIGTIVDRVQPNSENCLSNESCIIWNNGKMVQDISLKLRNVEHGEVEVQIEWIGLPGRKLFWSWGTVYTSAHRTMSLRILTWIFHSNDVIWLLSPYNLWIITQNNGGRVRRLFCKWMTFSWNGLVAIFSISFVGELFF